MLDIAAKWNSRLHRGNLPAGIVFLRLACSPLREAGLGWHFPDFSFSSLDLRDCSSGLWNNCLPFGQYSGKLNGFGVMSIPYLFAFCPISFRLMVALQRDKP